jgi:hypothetical protein
MKSRMFKLVLFAFVSTFNVFTQEKIWSDGSARTIPHSRFEMGFIQTPARYGLTDDIELSGYLLWEVLVPNLDLKKYWTTTNGFIISTTHSLYSPTPLLRYVAKERIGGLLPPDNYIPLFLVFDSFGIVSYEFLHLHTATARLGGKFAFAINDRTNEHPDYERLQTIDYPFIFSKTAFLTKTPAFSPEIGFAINGPLIGNLDYATKFNLYFFGIRDNLRAENKTCWAFEPSAIVIWNVSNSFACHLGVIYSLGNYPFGSNWVIYPLLDLKIGFGGDSKAQ